MSGQPPTQPRKVHVYLTREQSRMMNQEIGRLKQEHNVKLSGNEFFQVLLEMHRLRLQTLADDESDALPWMYSMLHDEA